MITLRQTQYVNEMFAKFLPKDHAKLWKLPVGGDEESLKAFMELAPAGTDAEAQQTLKDGYMSIIGAILWVSQMTRPDVAFHTAFLAKLMQRPSKAAFSAALGVICYLERTSAMGLTYGVDEGMSTYADSSFGRSPRPMAGHVVMYGGAALSWAAKALKIVPLSSAEAESAVLSLGCKDLMYVKQLVAELRPGRIPPRVPVHTDNTAAIDIIKAVGVTGRTKHFERWITYVRDLYHRYIVDVKYTPTDEMPADIFTKALGAEKFKQFRSFLLNVNGA